MASKRTSDAVALGAYLRSFRTNALKGVIRVAEGQLELLKRPPRIWRKITVHAEVRQGGGYRFTYDASVRKALGNQWLGVLAKPGDTDKARRAHKLARDAAAALPWKVFRTSRDPGPRTLEDQIALGRAWLDEIATGTDGRTAAAWHAARTAALARYALRAASAPEMARVDSFVVPWATGMTGDVEVARVRVAQRDQYESRRRRRLKHFQRDPEIAAALAAERTRRRDKNLDVRGASSTIAKRYRLSTKRVQAIHREETGAPSS